MAVAAAVLTGLLPVSAAFAVSGVGVGADEVDEVDDEAVAVLGGGAAGGGVDEFESVIGTSLPESSNELCFPSLRVGLLSNVECTVVEFDLVSPLFPGLF